MTEAQKSYLKTLSDEAREELNENLTKAEALKRIEELKHKTGRGLNTGVPNWRIRVSLNKAPILRRGIS
jgi:valyl-tRNA synthetase